MSLEKVMVWLKDLAALSLLQLVTMVMPVLMIPFLAASLGKEQLGQLAFMQAMAFYVALVVEFGMDFTGTRYVSKHREECEKISSYFFSVLFMKLVIISVIVIAFFTVELILDKFDFSMLFWCLLIGFFQGLNINWFYQGTARVRLASIAESLIKTSISIVIIYYSANYEMSVCDVLLFLAVSNILTFTFSYTLVSRYIIYSKPKWDDLTNVVRTSIRLFGFKLLSNTYSSGGVIVLGILAPIEYAGFYSYAEKIIRSVRGAIQPLTRLIFAKVSNLPKEKIYKFASYSVLLMVIINCCLALIIYSFSENIISLLFGKDWGEVEVLLKYMVILLPVLGFNTSITTFYLMPMGEDDFLIKLICVFTVIYCLISPYLVFNFFAIGALVSLVIVEVLIMVLLILKFKIIYFKAKVITNENS